MDVSADHPIQELLFYISDEFLENDVADMKSVIARMATEKTWIIAPPDFVDCTEQPESNNSDDEPIRTAGGLVRLYTAYPPWRDKLPKQIDRGHFEEVSFVIKCLCEFSARTGREIGLQLDQDEIGWINQGEPDSGIAIGLLGEWKKNL